MDSNKDSNQIALICKFLWSFVHAQTQFLDVNEFWWKWLQSVHMSCTFLHLTADCDGWEETDPGDSLDVGEG